jgi:hypothetical protein
LRFYKKANSIQGNGFSKAEEVVAVAVAVVEEVGVLVEVEEVDLAVEEEEGLLVSDHVI